MGEQVNLWVSFTGNNALHPAEALTQWFWGWLDILRFKISLGDSHVQPGLRITARSKGFGQ